MSAFCSDCGTSLTEKEVEGKNRLFCVECSQVIWQNPKPVAWLLVQKDDKYLLVKRADQPDKGEWDIPGGFLELEESFEEAAVRELKEETGVDLDPDEIEIYDKLSFKRDENYVVGIVFNTEINQVPELEAGDDAAIAKFWKITELKESGQSLRDICRPLL